MTLEELLLYVIAIGTIVYQYKKILSLRKRETDLEERANHLEEEANIDHLTGLANRRRFDEMIRRMVRSANEPRNTKDQTIGVIMLDLDGFKPVNDKHGHKAGDKVLRRVARLLEDAVRHGDFVFRHGGDEFLILLPGAGRADVKMIARRVRERISSHRFYLNSRVFVQVGASIGGISRQGPGLEAEDLLRMVDARMYEAKEVGQSGGYPVVVESQRCSAPKVSAVDLDEGDVRPLDEDDTRYGDTDEVETVDEIGDR